MYDYLIVGAGFAGSVLAERLARIDGKRVLIIDGRNHVGGNAYDHYDDSGVLVHKYGPHIFHTNSPDIFEYLSQFTEWRPYQHRVLASIDNRLLPFPINLTTLERFYQRSFDADQAKAFLAREAEPISELNTSEDVVVSKLGRNLFNTFFLGYTMKQWGLHPSQLDATVAGRVPARFDRDDRYFTDTFQFMPASGYTPMFESMLSHPNITIATGVTFGDCKLPQHKALIYTGPIDAYFGYSLGKLPYRSIQFRFEKHGMRQFQPTGTINYPSADYPFTRITEFNHLTGQKHRSTTVCYEYPTAEGEPYYPIPRPENAALYSRYRALAEATPGVHFVGRLGTYRYYNMDQVVAQALALHRRLQT